MGPTALLPLRRKACWGFFCPKNPTASARRKPANLGTKASTLPLDHRSHVTVPSKGAATQHNCIRDITNKLQTRCHFASSSLSLTLTWLIEPGNCLSRTHRSSATLAGCWYTSSILFLSVIWQGRNLLPSNSWKPQFLQPHQSEPFASVLTFLCGSSLAENRQLNRCELAQCRNTPVN